MTKPLAHPGITDHRSPQAPCSGHAFVASLARYTCVSPDALARWQAQRDPHRRR